MSPYLICLPHLPLSNPNEGTSNPAFSPDGQYVAYWSRIDNKLKKVSINGETPQPLCEATSNILGISWSAEDKIVYAEQGKGILQVSASGGTPVPLIPAKEEGFYHPQLLPDGQSIIYTLSTDEGDYKIVVQSLKSDEQRLTFPGDCAKYFPSGHIFYALKNNLCVRSFDLDPFELTGDTEIILKGIYRYENTLAPQYAISESKSGSRSLVYLPEARTETTTSSTLVLVDRKGNEQPLKFDPDAYCNPKFSPDGKRVAVVIVKDGIGKIYTGNIASGIMEPLTNNTHTERSPLWTINPPDQRIVFALLSTERAMFNIYSIPAIGTGRATQVSSMLGQDNYWPASWADNGETLIVVYQHDGYDIGKLSIKGDGRIEPLLNTQYMEAYPAISPNGQCIAYASNEPGDQMEVWVRPYPNVNSKKQRVSINGGDCPLWSADSRELFFRNGESVMTISVESDCSCNQSTLETLFKDPYVSADFALGRGLELHPWDISPDDKQFLMMKEVRSPVSSIANSPKINVIINWFEETVAVD